MAFRFIAKTVLEARDEAFDALSAIERGEIASVRFGCSPLVDQALFTGLCKMHKALLPSCAIQPERGDTIQLVDDVLIGALDAAVVTLPLKNAALRIEDLRSERLVVCLRKDDPLASKRLVQPADLQNNLKILYRPQSHPQAHDRLMELLGDVGVELEEYSRASHPTEMQALVREGYGFALMREGTPLESELTTRAVAGVDWTVDTAVIYRREPHPKTIPVLVRQFKRELRKDDKRSTVVVRKRSTERPKDGPIQLPLLG